VSLFAAGLEEPRQMRVAPNGDVFVVESGSGRIRVLRPSVNGEPRKEVFASQALRRCGVP
jgi:glucose/arabinose dehydrogenase